MARTIRRARRAGRALRVATTYAQRPTRQHVVHAVIFAGICASTVLAHTGLQDAALWLSLAVNGIWVFHG